MFKNYFKTAWRNLLKDKMHSFINIIGLSIGMAVATLIGLWIYDEISFNKNFENYDRIAQVVQNVNNNGEVQTSMYLPYPLADELCKNYGSDFKHVSLAYYVGDHVLSLNEKKLTKAGGYFEKEAPGLFSLKMIKGSSSLEDPASLLISDVS